MKKIIMVGGTNGLVENLYAFLGVKYQVNMCQVSNAAITRMCKIIKPDLIVIVKTQEVIDMIFRAVKAQIQDIPILAICNSDDDVAKACIGGNLHVLLRPINNNHLIEMIEKLTGGTVENNNKTGDEELNAKPLNASIVDNEEDETYGGLFSNKSKKRILAIDDNAIVLRGLKKILDSEYDVTVSTSAEQGVILAAKKPYDLVLLDYEMPQVDGYTAMQMFKNNPKTKDLPIVFLTGVADKERISDVVALKPAGYLLKPIDTDVLKDTIKKVLN